MSKEGIERIRAANPILRVLAERGIEVRKKGKSYLARCPFHSPDRSPSMGVTPSRGLFHCFTCGESGDVFGLVAKLDKLSFPDVLKLLATTRGLSADELMKPGERAGQQTPVEALTPPPHVRHVEPATKSPVTALPEPAPAEVLARVVEVYHDAFCDRADAQGYLVHRGIDDADLLRTLKVGYADGRLLKMVAGDDELRAQLVKLGVITAEGRELLGGCVVFPLPDPATGAWVSLYGRGVRAKRHCYLPGAMRGLLNYQATRSSAEVILTESIIDAVSLLQVGITSAVALHGVHGLTDDHLDALLKSPARRVVLLLDNDEPGRRASEQLRVRLERAGIAVRVATLPDGFKDVNDVLVAKKDEAGEILRRALVADAPPAPPNVSVPAAAPPVPAPSARPERTSDGIRVTLGPRSYHARVATKSAASDTLRTVLRVEDAEGRFLIDTVDLYAARSRREYARRAAERLALDAPATTGARLLEEELLQLIAPLEAARSEASSPAIDAAPAVTPMTDDERADALALLQRHDLVERIAHDVEALGYVGERTNAVILYLVATSRKLSDPMSAIVLSQSGAGKSALTQAIEVLMPPEDVMLVTRLTPQSLYYVEEGSLDHKLIIVEERYGSQEADYSIRVLQSRKMLRAAAPIKDPATGTMKTRFFTVVARAAFIEATTASAVNHENATRCFELSMDESVDQTRRIHERQRLMKTEAGLRLAAEAEAIKRRHWNAQRLLEPLPVVIPFADRLTFPSAWMRTRRDNARFLNLIEVSAFLHQHQRDRSNGAVVATLRDYETAYELAAEVLSETLTDLRRPLRDLLAVIRQLVTEKDGAVSRRELRERTALPDTTLVRYLRDLVELEYLTVTGKDKALLYEPAADECGRVNAALLTPAALHKLLNE